MLKSKDALAMFGVCSSAVGDPAVLAARMNAIGFTLLRCACETQAHLDFLLAVQKLVPGFRFNWLITGYNNNPVTDTQQFTLAAAAKAAGLNVVFVEAVNELNNPATAGGSHLPGSTTPLNNSDQAAIKAAILAWVTDIYNWFSTNWPSVIRLGSTALAYDAATWLALEPPDTNFIQYPVLHCYPPPGQQPCSFDGAGDANVDIGDLLHMKIWAERAQTGNVMGQFPVALTETGQPGGPVVQPNQVVDYTTQAKIIANIACDMMAQNLGLCIFYCLQDPGADPSNNGGPEPHYGMFNNDGSAKLAATVLHRFFGYFTGNGATDFTPKQLLVTVSGLGTTQSAAGCVAVVARPDGSYVIPVWNEPRIHDGTNTVTPTTVNAAVTWGSDFQYSVVDALNGQEVKFGSGSGVTVPLNGYPMIVLLTPKGSVVTTGSVANAAPTLAPSAAPAATAAAVATADHSLTIKLLQALQAGTYTLVPATPSVMQPLSIGLSEDAYQGDCMVNVSLDGSPLFTSLPVVQLRSANGMQAVPLGPVDSTKPHTVVISFLNDIYGGSPTTDRNLYVNSYTLGDKTVTVGGSQLSTGDYTLTIPAGG